LDFYCDFLPNFTFTLFFFSEGKGKGKGKGKGVVFVLYGGKDHSTVFFINWALSI
jgi:hypothetical protein